MLECDLFNLLWFLVNKLSILFLSIFICIGSLGVLFGGVHKGSQSDFFKINTVADYQRLSIIRDKIEILELIEDQLIPLTNNEILDSKMHDLKLYYCEIKEIQKSYVALRLSLKKYSHYKEKDIKALYRGAINFLDNQGKILEIVTKAIEKKPEAKALSDLSAVEINTVEYLTFKAKSVQETRKFVGAIEKVWDEISSYAAALEIEEAN